MAYDVSKQKALIDLTRSFVSGKSKIDADSLTELRETIVYHEWRYAVLNDPVISDKEYACGFPVAPGTQVFCLE